MKFFGLIVARSGSKGVPGKNMLKFNGKSLIRIVSETMVGAQIFSDTIISTDSKKYGEEAFRVGVGFKWLRPDNLASDDASIIDVINHTVVAEKLIERGFTHIVMAQPSSPFLSTDDIVNAVALIKSEKFDSVISATPHIDRSVNYLFSDVEGYCEWFMKSNGAFGNRQNLPQVYRRCGNLYCFSIQKFIKLKQVSCERCGYILVPQERSLCIDSHGDLDKLRKLGEVVNEG